MHLPEQLKKQHAQFKQALYSFFWVLGVLSQGDQMGYGWSSEKLHLYTGDLIFTLL